MKKIISYMRYKRTLVRWSLIVVAVLMAWGAGYMVRLHLHGEQYRCYQKNDIKWLLTDRYLDPAYMRREELIESLSQEQDPVVALYLRNVAKPYVRIYGDGKIEFRNGRGGYATSHTRVKKIAILLQKNRVRGLYNMSSKALNQKMFLLKGEPEIHLFNMPVCFVRIKIDAGNYLEYIHINNFYKLLDRYPEVRELKQIEECIKDIISFVPAEYRQKVDMYDAEKRKATLKACKGGVY